MKKFVRNVFGRWFLVFVAMAFVAGCCSTMSEHGSVTKSRWADDEANVEHLMNSTVAILHPLKGRPVCTGFFVSPTLIVSARHCYDKSMESKEGLDKVERTLRNMSLWVIRYEEYASAGLESNLTEVEIVYMPKNIDPSVEHRHDLILLKLAKDEKPSNHYLPIANDVPPLGARVYNVSMTDGQPWYFAEGVVQQYYYDYEHFPNVEVLALGMNVEGGASGSAVVYDGRVIAVTHRVSENGYDGAYVTVSAIRTFLYGWVN